MIVDHNNSRFSDKDLESLCGFVVHATNKVEVTNVFYLLFKTCVYIRQNCGIKLPEI